MNPVTPWRGLRPPILALLLLAAAASWLAAPVAAQAPLPELLPEELEVELALSAAPERLRDGAAVYVLRRGGYKQVKNGGNAYTCYVVRTVPRFDVQSAATLIPICFDEEGTRTIMPVHFEVARLAEQGRSFAEIRAAVESGFAQGRFGPPTRPGLSYMISPVLNLPDGQGGIRHYHPHFMFYAPQLDNAAVDTEAQRGSGWLPWINEPGPHGMFIVPVGAAERRAIVERERALIRRVNDFLREGE